MSGHTCLRGSTTTVAHRNHAARSDTTSGSVRAVSSRKNTPCRRGTHPPGPGLHYFNLDWHSVPISWRDCRDCDSKIDPAATIPEINVGRNWQRSRRGASAGTCGNTNIIAVTCSPAAIGLRTVASAATSSLRRYSLKLNVLRTQRISQPKAEWRATTNLARPRKPLRSSCGSSSSRTTA